MPSLRDVRRRSLLLAVAVGLAWHAVLFAAAFGLPGLAFSWFPDLGAVLVNLITFTATVALILRLGWQREEWFSRLRLRRPLLLLPVVVVSLTYLGQGLEGSVAVLAASAVLMISVGLTEELYSRGVTQRLLDTWPVASRVVLVGVIFGFGHALSAVAFGRPFGDTAFQVLSASLFGCTVAALRLHVVTVWPLAFLHALDDWTLVNSPGAAPDWWQLVVALASVAYTVVLVRSYEAELRAPQALSARTPVGGVAEPSVTSA